MPQRSKRRQGGSSAPEKVRPQWYSLSDPMLDMARLILKDVISNDKKSQIILVIPLTAVLYGDHKTLHPLFKICDSVGDNYSVSRNGHDYYQLPCTLSEIGFEAATNTDSILIQFENSEFCDKKTVSLYFAG